MVEGDSKASFSLWCKGRRYCPHFTLDTYLILLSVKQGSIKYHF